MERVPDAKGHAALPAYPSQTTHPRTPYQEHRELEFIYPTYRAAGTEASRDKHSLKSSHQGVAYVSSSVGGSVSTLSFQDTTPSNYWRPPMRRAGGIRDRVRASQGLAAEIYSGVWRASTEAPSGP